MNGIITPPENIKNYRRYWLAADGIAYQVDDHLLAAQYAKADSSEFEKPFPWTYEDMFRHGWVRVHTEKDVIWADIKDRNMSSKQKAWLKDAAIFLGAETGERVRISRGLENKEQILSREDVKIKPTQTFLEVVEEITRRYFSKV